MPRDHYVASTYLKHFIGPSGMLQAYRKSDGVTFPCHPNDVCHEMDGDKIPDFLKNENLLGEYRSLFEPSWNSALNDLSSGRLTPETKMAISGYCANLMACTPAWRRVGVDTYNRNTAEHLEARDILQTEHGKQDERLTEALQALRENKISIKTEPDYVRARTAISLLRYAWAVYNSDWILIRNNTGLNFLTSDNPVCFQDPGPHRTQRGLPRYLPVSPNICVYFNPISDRAESDDPDFRQPPQGRIGYMDARPLVVRNINKAVVQCAENLVISPQKSEAIAALVRKYADYRVEMELIKVREPNGFLFGNRTRVRRVPKRQN
jgi:hypothetical protein